MLNKAYIDLNVLRQNALSVKSKLKKRVKFCAVVKADAYGHGACVVANALYNIVDSYAVALLEEAIDLRLSGIDKDILVLVPFFEEDIEKAVSYKLTATVCNKYQVEQLNSEGERTKTKVKVHIKYNTGMNRQGVDGLENLNDLLEFISKCKWVKLDGLYSHFADPSDKKSKIEAEKQFLLANNLVKRYNNKAICHISASGGFLVGSQWDMVRIGILLYGYKPFKSNLVEVLPVMKVYAKALIERQLKKGESSLYGFCPSNENLSIKLVRFGYADGLPRQTTPGQFNNRCMDISAVTDSDSEEYPILLDADVLAKKYQTISYEILVGISRRAQKIYIN